MRLTLQQIHTLKSDLGELADYRLEDEYSNKSDLDERGLSPVEAKLYETLSILAARNQHSIPDTVVIDVSNGVVDEISSNHDVNVILLDSDLESLDIESANETFELNGTIYATRDTGHASYNPSRTQLVYNAVQERDARVQAEKDSRIQTELLTQADYERFNEFFRVETHALGRSVIKPALRGLEYVDEEVYGTEEEIRLIPLKVLGQQFDMVEPVTKPVPEMIADYVKLSKVHNCDAKLIRQHFIEK